MLDGHGTGAQAGRAGPGSVPPGAPPLLQTASRLCALGLVAGLVAAPLLLGRLHAYGLTQLFFRDQDVIWIAVAASLLFGLTIIRRPLMRATVIHPLARHPDWTTVGLTVFVVAVAAIGAFLVFRGFHLSRDEIMADFDAVILGSGRLVAPLPPEWQGLKNALNPEFLLPIPGPVWASSYLPGNAALRAVVGCVMDRAWTSPLLAGVAMLALYRITRRLWPDRPDVTVVSLVLLAASSQVLVTAMTSYAMTAHLALDLVWLALFLRDDRRGHVGAIGIGALATGLHQIVFHPLFVAPFIVQLWVQRRRRLALGYVAAYALIGAFWASYWSLVLPGSGAETGSLAATAAKLLARFSTDGIALMLANLLRFVAWQHLLLLPLACAALAAVRRDEGIARPLAGGILLTLAVVFVLLPYQGHGWGFRYLHGVLGNLCLLGAYGWIAVTSGTGARERDHVGSIFGLTTAFALIVMLPVHVAQAVRMVAPYRAATAAIERTPADIVLVDPTGIAFAADLVRNDPFLRNRPKVLDLDLVSEPQLAQLCAHSSVAVFGLGQASALGVMLQPGPQPEQDAVRARRRDFLARLGCGVAVASDPNGAAVTGGTGYGSGPPNG